jgi:hypothetical protein
MLKSMATEFSRGGNPVTFARPRASGRIQAFENLSVKPKDDTTVDFAKWVSEQAKGGKILAIKVNPYVKDGINRYAVEFSAFEPKKAEV